MPYIAKDYHCSSRLNQRLLRFVGLSLAFLASGPVLADQIDCERVRTGKEPIRFTVSNVAETEMKKPPQKTVYIDVVRNSPEGIVWYTYLTDYKLKSIFTKILLPLSIETIGKSYLQTISYDSDTSKLTLGPGSAFTFNAVEALPTGSNTMAHHVYSVTEGGSFEVAGCSFPVVSVHHTAHFKRDAKEWDLTTDSLVSLDLGAVLKSRRQIVADPGVMESAILVNTVTDLSTTVDMTKAP